MVLEWITIPWDSDIDVQMPILDLHKLSRYLNQSVIVDFGHDINNIRLGRYFLTVPVLYHKEFVVMGTITLMHVSLIWIPGCTLILQD